MIEVIQLKNELLESNCFMVVDTKYGSCIIIDPASEESKSEKKYIDEKKLRLEYVILTHTHADHCWGANILKNNYKDSKLVYHDDKYMKREMMLFFRMWHEDENYSFDLTPADIQIEIDTEWKWQGHKLRFILTPGHSVGSICIEIDGNLFTGDTIMPFPPYFNGRGSDRFEWEKSVKKLVGIYKPDTKIYPGHGEALTLGEWMSNENYSKINKNV